MDAQADPQTEKARRWENWNRRPRQAQEYREAQNETIRLRRLTQESDRIEKAAAKNKTWGAYHLHPDGWYRLHPPETQPRKETP